MDTTKVEQSDDTAYIEVPLNFERLPEGEMLRRSRAFLATMQRRRSTRYFSDEPVPFEVVENAVRAAASALSGANRQPWSFVVVSDPETKRRIREAAEVEEREFYADGPADWLRALAPLGTDAVKQHMTTAPHLIVVFAQAYGYATGPGGEQVKAKNYYVAESFGIAVGFLIASLAHAGLTTLTHTPSPMGFLARVLDRPPNERAYLVLPVGYPAQHATIPAHALRKKPLAEVLVRR